MIPRQLLSLSLLILCSYVTAQAAPLGLLVHEETFNLPTHTLAYRNGAATSESGSGVSGHSDDRAYAANLPDSINRPGGPMAELTSFTEGESFDAFTATLWYRLSTEQPELMVPFSVHGIQLLFHKQGPEIRIENSDTDPRFLQFTPGGQGPHLPWRKSDVWIFFAFSWDRETNTLSIYQGTDQQPVRFMRNMNRPVPTKPSMPRDDLDRYPDTIGNTHGPRNDRPLAGRLDNIRLYRTTLPPDALELIRQCDLQNVTPPIR